MKESVSAKPKTAALSRLNPQKLPEWRPLRFTEPAHHPARGHATEVSTLMQNSRAQSTLPQHSSETDLSNLRWLQHGQHRWRRAPSMCPPPNHALHTSAGYSPYILTPTPSRPSKIAMSFIGACLANTSPRVHLGSRPHGTPWIQPPVQPSFRPSAKPPCLSPHPAINESELTYKLCQV